MQSYLHTPALPATRSSHLANCRHGTGASSHTAPASASSCACPSDRRSAPRYQAHLRAASRLPTSAAGASPKLMPRRTRIALLFVMSTVTGAALYLLGVGHGAEPVIAVVLAFVWGALARWPGAVFLFAYLAAILIDPRPDPAPVFGLEIPDTKHGNALAGLFFIIPAFAIGVLVRNAVSALWTRRRSPIRSASTNPQPHAEHWSAGPD